MPGMDPAWLSGCEKALRTGMPSQFEARLEPSGRWVAGTATRLEGPGSLRVAVVFTDITSDKESEAKFRASEEKYRALFDSIDEGLCLIEVLFDENGKPWDYRFLEANPAFEKHTGMKLEKSLGRSMRELAPGHEDHWYEIYGKITLTGEPARFEQSAEALGRYFDVYAFRTGRPEERRVAVLFNDITPRKQAEAALKADFSATQTLSDLGTRIIPHHTGIQALYEDVNAAGMKLAGSDAGTVQIFDPLTSELVLLATHGFPPDSPQRFGRVSAASATSCGVALTSGERTFVDFDDPSLEDPKGDLQWHVAAGYRSAQSTPLLTRSGKPIGMISTHWRERRRLTERETRHFDLLARQAADLIEQRMAFEEIRAARMEAEAAGRAKDHFLAVLSHELRTPLTPVVMQLEMILDEPDLDPELQAALEMIKRNVILETRLIDDLLDITRIGQGKLEIQHLPLDVHDVALHALELCGPEIGAKKHRITTVLDAPRSVISGDMTRLQQVFWNLFKNAAKFTPPQGTIEIRSRTEGAFVEIVVSDDGMGWNPEIRPPIFDAFIQGDSSVTKKFGGLGLGLAISQAIVVAHGGTLEGHSPGPGQGASFTVRLPLEERPQ